MEVSVKSQNPEVPARDTSESEVTEFGSEDSPAEESNAPRKRSSLGRLIPAGKRTLHLATNPIIVPVEDGSEQIPVGRVVKKGALDFPTGKTETRPGWGRIRTESVSPIVKTGMTGSSKLDPSVSQILTPLAEPVNSPQTSASPLSTESEAISQRNDSSPIRAGEVVGATNEPDTPTSRSPGETNTMVPPREVNLSGETQVVAASNERKTASTPFSAATILDRNISSTPTSSSEAGEVLNDTRLSPSSNRSPAIDASPSLGSFVRSDTQSESRSSLSPENTTVNPAPNKGGALEPQREIRTPSHVDSNLMSTGENRISRTSELVNVAAQFADTRSAAQAEPSSDLRPEVRAVNLAQDANDSRGSDDRSMELPPIRRNPGSLPQPQIGADGSKGEIVADADRQMPNRSPDRTESAPFEITSPRSREAQRELITSAPEESHLARHDENQKSVLPPASLKVAAQFTGARSTEKEMTFEAKGSKNIIMQDDNKQIVKNYDPAVGINPAKPADNMPSLVQSPPSSLPIAPVTDAAPVTRLDTARMIERIDSAAAQISAQKGQNVDLKIDLDSGQQLSVRITMQEGRVRAAFQTDHPALRESLASAWPTFVAQRESSAMKWADPVFAAPVTTSAPTAVVTAATPVDSGTNFSSSPQHEQPSSHDRAEREESSLRFATRSKLATPSNSGVNEKSDEPVNPRSAILPGLRVFA